MSDGAWSRHGRLGGLLLLMWVSGALAAPGAEEQRPQELASMTVTANKVEQWLEEVPASLSLFHGDDLRDAMVEDLAGVARRTPSFGFQPIGQSGTNLPVVRGLTSHVTAFSSSMLMLVDGVPTLMGQGFEHNLLGVERVEVLRGPQSTLYGRNADAGVLNIHTRQPGGEPYARFDAALGSRDKRSLRFDLGGELVTDSLSASFAGEWREQDGFIDNPHRGRTEGDRERYAGRAALRWTPSPGSDVTLRYARQAYRDGGAHWGRVDAPRREVHSGTASWNRSSGRVLALDIEHELTENLHFRSLSARHDFHDHVRQDADFQPLDMLHVERDHHLSTLSQEFRLEGEGSRHQWLLGLYADSDDHELGFRQQTPVGLQDTDVDLGGDSRALFGQWTQALAPDWSLTLGGRIERNRVSLTAEDGSRQERDWQRFTPKMSLQHEWSPDTHLYASYAEGFRAGGFNAFARADGFPAYDPQRVASYEVGLKGWALDRRLRYAAAAYWMDVNDMQVQQITQPGVVHITNAAKAYSTGLELEADYLIGAHWSLQAALGVNRTRFREFQDLAGDHRGNHNPFAPDLDGYLGLRYDAPSGWYAQAGLSGVGRTYLDAANDHRRDAYGRLDLSAGYRHRQYGITAYVDNATDERYDAVGFLNGMARVYSEPRELGLRVSVDL